MKAQEREGMPRHALIIDQETRWSSTYLMLERFLVQKQAIILAYIEFEKFDIQMLESGEWAILPTVVALLKIFADVINFCGKVDSCTSEAIPSAKSVMMTLEETDYKGVEGMFDNMPFLSKEASCM